jgi:hypothetical protein
MLALSMSADQCPVCGREGCSGDCGDEPSKVPCPRCLMQLRMSSSRRADIDQLERLAHTIHGRERLDEAPDWQRDRAHDDVLRALTFPDARPSGLSLETFDKIREAATALGIDVERHGQGVA